MGLAIGSLFFLMIHYLSLAGWNVAAKRVSESLAFYLFLAFVFNVLLFFGLGKVYPWTNHAWMMSSEVMRGKISYFSTSFYVIRSLIFFALILIATWKLLGNSLAQDEEGGTELMLRQKPVAALFLVFFGPFFTVYSVDLIISVEPKWFSTVFGVYLFIGFVQAAIAALVIAIYLLQRKGYLEVVTPDHFHDMGKYLFGFSIFWAYIAIAQYLLIWYANLPEETAFYLRRSAPGWHWADWAVPTLRFGLPFLLLLPRFTKRNAAYLSAVSVLVLLGSWLDLYWLVMPSISPQTASISVWDIGVSIGFLGFFAFAIRYFLSRHPTVPLKDPLLHETLHHHVM
jgi:hypothetical protein